MVERYMVSCIWCEGWIGLDWIGLVELDVKRWRYLSGAVRF